MEDQDFRLLAAARNGDEASFLNLWQLHRTALFQFAWRLTGSVSAAEDITQECFLVVLGASALTPSLGSVRGYLFGISRNLVRKRCRIINRESDEEADIPDPAVVAPLDAVLLAERAEAVAHAVTCLPPNQREAVILFEYEGFSLEEIAGITGVETGAVKARLHRARETLRRRLAPLLGLQQERRAHEA